MATIITRQTQLTQLTHAQVDANFTNLNAALVTAQSGISALASSTGAASVGFAPTGGIASANVQAALAELDGEKANVANPSFTGVGRIGTAAAPSTSKFDVNGSTPEFSVSSVTSAVGADIGSIKIYSDASAVGSARWAGMKAVVPTGAAGIDYTALAWFTNNGGTANAERMRLSPAGNLGIGTNAPGYPLDVNGTIRALNGSIIAGGGGTNGLVSFNRSDNVTAIGTIGWVTAGDEFRSDNNNGGMFTWRVNSSEKMRLDNNGKLLVGRTASNGGAYVMELDGTTDVRLGLSVGGTLTGSVQALANTLAFAAQGASGILRYVTNGIIAATIDSSQNLLLGTTSTIPSYAARLAIKYAGGAAQYGINLQAGSDNTAAIMFTNAAGSSIGTIGVTATATAYNTSSDYRLKSNVLPMVGALDSIMRMRPVVYKWIADGSNGEGFIAHELAEEAPLAVTGEKDADVYQSIDPSKIVGRLVAAIQELKREFDEYKAAHP